MNTDKKKTMATSISNLKFQISDDGKGKVNRDGRGRCNGPRRGEALVVATGWGLWWWLDKGGWREENFGVGEEKAKIIFSVLPSTAFVHGVQERHNAHLPFASLRVKRWPQRGRRRQAG
jgi:hypothetical protein